MAGSGSQGRTTQQPSDQRRRFLRRVGTAALVGVAGCATTPGDATGGERSRTTEASVIVSTSFEGTDLVVNLRDDHGVSALNLIAPDGTLFEQANVATGARTVRLPLLSIEAGGRSKHYTPGVHELVAVAGEVIDSLTLDLRPSLGITDIHQYRDGTTGADYGNLVVTVENTGTAPTWVYSIVYDGAPNFAANNELSGNPGIVFLSNPTEKSELILPSGASKEYIGAFPPLLFDDDRQSRCRGEAFEFTVIIGTPVDSALDKQVRVQTGGEAVGAGLVGQYTCEQMKVQRISDPNGGE